jgi:ABC-type protease/lipase transport system fused ATPase/permease subunit
MKTSNHRTPLSEALLACYPALGATFVLSLFINASMLASPLYSMQVYDRVLTSRNVGTLLMLTLIVAIFLVLYGVLEFARSGVLARAGAQFERRLRRPLFETMMRAELSPRHRIGQQVIRDAETVRDGLSNGPAAILCDLPWTPVFIILCYLQHSLLGLVALCCAMARSCAGWGWAILCSTGGAAPSRRWSRRTARRLSAARRCMPFRNLPGLRCRRASSASVPGSRSIEKSRPAR